MKTIQDLRKALKPLGFNVKTKAFSHGPHATYTHTATGQELPMIFFSDESRALWEPLEKFQRENYQALIDLRKITGVYGLLK